MVRVLFSSACYDYPTSVAYNLYTKYVEPYYRAKGIEVVQCHCQNAMRDRIEETIEFYVCNVDPLKGRGVYLLSCSTAKELGYDIVNKGGKAYVGYYEDFTWVVGELSTDPYGDIYQASFFRPIEVFLKALADGKTIKEATDAQVDQFNKEIEYWRNSGDPYAVYVIYYLIWDRDAIRLYGDENWALITVVELKAEHTLAIMDSANIERKTTKTYDYIGVLPLVGLVATAYGIGEKDERKRMLFVAGGLGSLAVYYIFKSKYKPLKPITRPTIFMTAGSSINIEDRIPIEIPIESSSSVSLLDLSIITPAILVGSNANITVEDIQAEIGTPIPVEGGESLSVYCQATFVATGRLTGSSSVSLTDVAMITVARTITPTSSVSLTDVAMITVARTITPTSSVSLTDTASIGTTTSVEGGESLSVYCQATITTVA
ncbi:MAG: hypothetical protein QW794_03210 [Thermosphaera sp.]